MSAGALVVAVFLATLVEAVEATTIVLAAGAARDWRSSLTGAAAALLALAVAVGALGPAISAVPLRAVRIVVGAALLLFGLKWLRKAVLRASGYKALHDEAATHWPGDDVSLLVIVPAIAAVALGLAGLLRYRRARSAIDVEPLDSSNALIKPS